VRTYPLSDIQENDIEKIISRLKISVKKYNRRLVRELKIETLSVLPELA
jgi:hypothetical protein